MRIGILVVSVGVGARRREGLQVREREHVESFMTVSSTGGGCVKSVVVRVC